MLSSLWMPGAEIHDVGDHALTDGQYPAKAIAHITWDKNGTSVSPIDLVPYSNLRTYFTGSGVGMAPHILWDPFEGRFCQFYPANSRSKSVVDLAGGTRTNRAGKVVIQIEALFSPYCRYGGKVYAKLSDTPCKGWDKLQAWVHAWGVLNTWPMGKPNGFISRRNEHIWETEGGWYAHGDVPENTHTDPGSWPSFVQTSSSGGTTKPTGTNKYTPPTFPTGLKPNSSSPSAKTLQKALKVTKWLAQDVELSDNYGPKTQNAVAGFNDKHNLNSQGVSYDPAIGPKGWALLFTLAYG